MEGDQETITPWGGAMFHTALDASITIDSQGKIIHWQNKTMQEITRIKQQSLP